MRQNAATSTCMPPSTGGDRSTDPDGDSWSRRFLVRAIVGRATQDDDFFDACRQPPLVGPGLAPVGPMPGASAIDGDLDASNDSPAGVGRRPANLHDRTGDRRTV